MVWRRGRNGEEKGKLFPVERAYSWTEREEWAVVDCKGIRAEIQQLCLLPSSNDDDRLMGVRRRNTRERGGARYGCPFPLLPLSWWRIKRGKACITPSLIPFLFASGVSPDAIFLILSFSNFRDLPSCLLHNLIFSKSLQNDHDAKTARTILRMDCRSNSWSSDCLPNFFISFLSTTAYSNWIIGQKSTGKEEKMSESLKGLFLFHYLITLDYPLLFTWSSCHLKSFCSHIF